jgi:hypothetical protein
MSLTRINNNSSRITRVNNVYYPGDATKGGIFVGISGTDQINLPVGSDGYLLTADSTQTSGIKWAAAPVSLPAQTGNTGKYLTTDGTTASWASVVALPTQTGNSGKILTTDGTNASWSYLNSIGGSGVAGTAGTWNTTVTAPTGTTQLNYEGYLYATKVYNAVFNDYAEYFEKADNTVTPGDIISINKNGEGYVKSQGYCDNLVVGVYSDDYAQCIGGKGDGNDDINFISVGMAGRVRVKVTGNINPGDLLVSSEIPGVAVAGNKQGCVIGKALESHSGEEIHRIKCLILNA